MTNLQPARPPLAGKTAVRVYDLRFWNDKRLLFFLPTCIQSGKAAYSILPTANRLLKSRRDDIMAKKIIKTNEEERTNKTN